ncbi:hypothetical protein CKF54_05410 [Psittacicella hinzii]|uniref:H+/Cl-antiporter ClcA n=1 Tax=Psittacicella hinzii TaxID=2028575 RepID=A0A3A1Y459_9GAMM|nr:chloride channel protein [Psittacicella hinzii]RIY32089.1 hypothetical protein CKF54_05410 [Psittacicella hinzii]
MKQELLAKLRLALAVVLIGIFAGLGAAFLSWLIHKVEILAFGHSETTYRIVTDDTTWQRRLFSLAIGGVIIGALWAWLQVKGKPVVGIKGMMEGKKPSFMDNIAHSLLQILAVGVGAPIGREVAPREVGATFASYITRFCRIDDPKIFSVLVACGAAAGLAGVYHVPFAGAIFALEILIGVINVPYAVIAISTSVIATFVARIVISPEVFYLVPQIEMSTSHVWWSVLLGLLVGIPAKLFGKQVKWAEANRTSGKEVMITLPFVFVLTGIVAIWLPQILGNGRSAVQSAYWLIPVGLGALLFVFKWLMVIVNLRAGAFGGTLTPGFALGALFGLVAGGLIHSFGFHSMDVTMAAVVCSGAFLAVSMNAPLTAFALTIGFTGQGFDGYVPIIAGISVAMAVGNFFSFTKKDKDAKDTKDTATAKEAKAPAKA